MSIDCLAEKTGISKSQFIVGQRIESPKRCWQKLLVANKKVGRIFKIEKRETKIAQSKSRIVY